MIKPLLVVVMTVFSVAAGAQQRQLVQVQKAVSQFIKAMEDSDLKSLDRLTADPLTYGHSSGKIENKEQFLQTFQSGASDFVKINITEQTIDIDGKTAIVRHVFDADTNDNNQPGHVRLKILTVWKQQSKAHWVLLARQAVKPPAP